jgi:hypothetical protein
MAGSRGADRIMSMPSDAPSGEDAMNSISSLSKVVRRSTGLALVWLGATLFAASPMAAGTAQDAGHVSDPKIVGTWVVQVTLRDCTSGAPLRPAFNSLVTFNRGGTLAESTAGHAFAPTQRTNAHGSWERLSDGGYAQRMISLLLFDTAANLPGTPGFDPASPITPGFFAGWQTLSHTARLTDDDRLVSEGTNTFYKADGTVYRTGCSSAVGQRFK